jgi:hypothetical protein
MPSGLCFTPDQEDEDLNVQSLSRGDRAALTTQDDSNSGACFAPDHEDEHLNIASLNRSDRAALTTLENPGFRVRVLRPITMTTTYV